MQYGASERSPLNYRYKGKCGGHWIYTFLKLHVYLFLDQEISLENYFGSLMVLFTILLVLLEETIDNAWKTVLTTITKLRSLLSN